MQLLLGAFEGKGALTGSGVLSTSISSPFGTEGVGEPSGGIRLPQQKEKIRPRLKGPRGDH